MKNLLGGPMARRFQGQMRPGRRTWMNWWFFFWYEQGCWAEPVIACQTWRLKKNRFVTQHFKLVWLDKQWTTNLDRMMIVVVIASVDWRCWLNQLSFLLYIYYIMLFNLIAITAVIFLITSSYALSVDSSRHARHQRIARRPPLKRPSATARCKKKPFTSVAAPTPTSTPHHTLTSTSHRTSTAHPSPSSTAHPSPTSSPPSTSGNRKVGIDWASGDPSSIKNFVTKKVSTFVDFFLFSSFPYLFFPAYTIGALVK